MDNTSNIKFNYDKELIVLIQQKGIKKLVSKGDFIFNATLTPGLCYIDNGTIDVFRKDDKLLIGNIENRVVVGLPSLFYPVGYIAKAKTDCTCFILKKEDALVEIEKNNLWKSVAELLAYQISRHINRDANMVGRNAYSIIKHNIEEFSKLSPESRKTIKIATYIIHRSGLSKSRVYSILQQLSEGGYLKIAHGVLVDVKKLPSDF